MDTILQVPLTTFTLSPCGRSNGELLGTSDRELHSLTTIPWVSMRSLALDSPLVPRATSSPSICHFTTEMAAPLWGLKAHPRLQHPINERQSPPFSWYLIDVGRLSRTDMATRKQSNTPWRTRISLLAIDFEVHRSPTWEPNHTKDTF
ncbi:hypothetical protein CC2G_004543 [Coprinopsis cinerea AmutBmut pab1-1]|nr:hypothetical protein CC2G_004543 [Coprinopsis cinerea AmutBmut pab1-1]